jgi:hypothetical protein
MVNEEQAGISAEKVFVDFPAGTGLHPYTD